MKYLLFLLPIGLLACSHLSQVESSEKSQTSALMKDQSAQKAKDAQSADITREIVMAAAEPWTPKNVKVIDQLADLNLKLTGPGDMSDAKLAAQTQKLFDDAENAATVAAMQARVDAANQGKAKADATVKTTTAKLYAVSNGIALGLDSADSFFTKCWIIGGLAVALLVFVILCKIGIVTGHLATTVASKVP